MKIEREDLQVEAERMRREVAASYGPAERSIPTSNWASIAAHPCPFYLWAIRARPMDLPEPWDGLPRIFAEGRDSERKVRRLLEDAGYEITHEQVRFRDEDLDITGRIDGYVRRRGSPVCDSLVPYETKGYSEHNFSYATSFESMLEAPYWRVRMAPGQVLLYAYMAPEERPVVCFVPRNKSTGEIAPFFEFADEWFHLLERIGETIAQVNIALKTGEEPEPMLYDPTYCERCDAAAICPRIKKLRGGGEIEMHISADLDALAAQYVREKPHKSEYDSATRKIKAFLEGAGIYEPAEVGTLRTVVTQNHRISVDFKKNGRYLTVIALDEFAEQESKDGE